MTWWGALAGLMAVAVLAIGTVARAGGVHPHPGQTLEGTRSIGDLIATSGDAPVHLVFIHGIRAEGPGASQALRGVLCDYVKDGCRLDPPPPEGRRQYMDLGSAPPPVFYMGAPVWTAADWPASRPFVDRYVFRRNGGGPVVVDEVNWWPLLFPLKCRYLLSPEVQLSGPDRKHLRLCATSTPPYHAWLDATDVENAIRSRTPHAGGAMANRWLKAEIMNWGLSDAVIAVGPMQQSLHQTMDAVFAYASTFEGRSVGEQAFVVISESLGSFVVLDAFGEARSPALESVLAQTYDLYFFANQFRILEFGRLNPPPSASPLEGVAPARTSPSVALQRWATPPVTEAPISALKQIIAFNDPSDALTYEVPPVAGAKVVNLYDRNGWNLLGLVADPVAAHTGHSRNKAVLRTLFERRQAR